MKISKGKAIFQETEMQSQYEYHSKTNLRTVASNLKGFDYRSNILNVLRNFYNIDLDAPILIIDILDKCGIDEAFLFIEEGGPNMKRLERHFHAFCAEQLLHIFENEFPGDFRVRDQIKIMRNDKALSKERFEAESAVRDAIKFASKAGKKRASLAATESLTWAGARSISKLSAEYCRSPAFDYDPKRGYETFKISKSLADWPEIVRQQEIQLRKMLTMEK